MSAIKDLLEANLDTVTLISNLAELPDSDFRAAKRDELRIVLSRLRAKDARRIYTLKKDEIIGEIVDVLSEAKLTLQKAEAFDRVVPDLAEDELEKIDEYIATIQEQEDLQEQFGEILEDTYSKFREIVQTHFVDGVWQRASSSLSDLAYATYGRISAMRSKNPADKDALIKTNTRLWYRTQLLNKLEALLKEDSDQWYFKQAWRYLTGNDYGSKDNRGINESFCKSIYAATKYTDSKEKAEQKVKMQLEQITTAKIADITLLLEWAKSILTNLQDTTPKKEWRAVSTAIAIATGRRMAETHSSAKFTLKDEYTLTFEGQAKLKGKALEVYEDEPAYDIPTLVPASLVIKGHEWLRLYGKILEDKRQVNKLLNKELNQYVKWPTVLPKLIGLTDLEGNKVSGYEFTYHDLRALYGQAAWYVEGYKVVPNADFMERYMTIVLGDDARNPESQSTTALGYRREFRVSPESQHRV